MPSAPMKPRPRPIDALFGEAPSPNFIVEAPQPLTTVSPPPLDIQTTPPPTAAAAPAPPLPPPPVPASATGALASPESITAVTHPRTEALRQLFAQKDERYFADLPETIRGLYEDVEIELADSPSVAKQCMRLLRQARAAYQADDLASAEFYVKTVQARLRASELSASAATNVIVLFLLFWFLGTLALDIILVVITIFSSLTIFEVLINPGFTVVLRLLGCGGLGGVIGAMGGMFRSIQQRQYDPAANLNYFARPLFGMIIGAILYLLVQAGVFAGGGGGIEARAEEIPVGPVLLYFFATLAGFKQEYVFEFFDSLLRVLFRIPKPEGRRRALESE